MYDEETGTWSGQCLIPAARLASFLSLRFFIFTFLAFNAILVLSLPSFP